MRSRILCAAALVLLSALGLGAEAGALGLADIRAAVLERSAGLRGALLSAEAAALDQKAASYAALPSLSVSASAGLDYGLSPAAASSSASLGLRASQSLYDGGRSRAEAAIAALQTESARAGARAAYAQAVNAAESAYYGYLGAQAAALAAESGLEAARTALELATAKREAGALSAADLLSAQSAAAAKASALSQARKSLAIARASLESLAGLPPGSPIAELDFAPYEALAARLSALSDGEAEALAARLLAFAAAESPGLAQAALSLRLAEGRESLASRQYAPSVSASYSHSLGYAERGGLSAGSGSLGLSASLQIAPWSAKAAAASAGMATEKASVEAGEARRSLELELRGGLYGLLAAARDIPSSALALEYAEKRREAVLELFRRSAASATELSDAQAAADASRKALLAARFGFVGLLSDLRALAGAADEAALLALLP